MPYTIMDGSGKAYSAKVDSENRLHTKAITVTELTAATEDALTFVGASGFITLNDTAAFSGVYYLKNNTEDKDFHIDTIRTCNDGFTYWETFTTPSGGTLLSSGTAVPLTNGSIGSTVNPSSISLSGADTLTVTGGTSLGTHMQGAGHSVQEFKGGVDVTPGQSLAIVAKPANAGTIVCLQLVGFAKPTGVV